LENILVAASTPVRQYWMVQSDAAVEKVTAQTNRTQYPQDIEGDLMEGKIALEEHFSTELNNSYWNAKGEENRNGRSYAQDVERRLLDPEACVREMDRAGIEMCIMSLTSPGVQSVVNAAKAEELARSANDYAATFIKQFPGRFAAFAAVAIQNPEAGADEVERAVTELGMKGVLMNGYTNVGPGEEIQYLDEAAVRPFWERVAKLNVPVYLHPREPLPSQTRSIQGYPELVGSAWAFTYETSSHALRLMLSGLFDELPSLQIILGHLGEGIPYLLPRMQHRLDEQRDGEKGAKARHRASYYFAQNFWITTSGHFHTGPFLEAVEQIGRDRILFSVDYPYEQMDVAGRWFDELQIVRELKEQIGRENANVLFKLGLSPLANRLAEGFGS
jgi:predicted TIM-barrel fold metal-dependent hydrolase